MFLGTTDPDFFWLSCLNFESVKKKLNWVGVDDSWRVRFEAINKVSKMGWSHKCT